MSEEEVVTTEEVVEEVEVVDPADANICDGCE